MSLSRSKAAKFGEGREEEQRRKPRERIDHGRRPEPSILRV